MKSVLFLVVGLATAGLVACGGDDGDGGGSGNGDGSGGGSTSSDERVSSEQVNGGCPSDPTRLKGSGSKGSSCTSETECAPTCCNCASGSASYLAAACVDGACADPCALVDDSNHCEE